MAYIKVIEASQKRNGKPVKRYAVIWREPVRDAFGLHVPENANYFDLKKSDGGWVGSRRGNSTGR
jgi:hypothetical protein